MKIVVALLLLLLVHDSMAQNEQPFFPQQDLDAYNYRMQQITRNGMYSLTGWAAANIVSGAIAAPLSSGGQRYFHIMNASWNVVNLAIGIPGIITASKRENVRGLQLGKTRNNQRQQEQLFLINAGLDFAYMGAGAALWGFSNRVSRQQELMTGFGQSLLLQGGFLLIFDWTMYALHTQHANKKSNKYISGLACTGAGFSYRLAF